MFLDILENITRYRNLLDFPNEEDFRGAANGLKRLQKTYNITAASMADGILNGVKYRFLTKFINQSRLFVYIFLLFTKW